MNSTAWDTYFYTHYKPTGNDWGKSDLIKYKRWYTSWIAYIKKKGNFSFNNKDALELGCGIGSVSSLLFEQGCTITGTDISPVIVSHAKKVNPELDFKTYDVMKKYKEKKLFDFIFAFEVLEHIPLLEKAVKNISTALRKEGWFIGSTPYPYKKNMIDPTHVHVHHPEFWKKVFLNNGFSTVSTYPMSFFPLLWKLPGAYNPVIPFYISLPYFVSTTLILAKKK